MTLPCVISQLLSASGHRVRLHSWIRSSTSRKHPARRSGGGESLTDSALVWDSRRQAPRFGKRSAFPKEFIGFTHMRRQTIG